MADGSAFRLAIIGAGGIANAHAGAVASSGGRLALTAVVDPRAEGRDKLASQHGARGFESTAELLRASKADALFDGAVVCTPPSVRVPIVKALLEAGVPVLSEKPLAHTLADARKLAALAARHKRTPAFVGYCHRFSPAILAMKRFAAEGRIGRVFRFENIFACDLPGHSDKWFSDPKKAGGGAYLDMGSHSLDLFHFLVGPARTVGSIFDHKWKKRTETAATVLLRSTKKAGPYLPAGLAGLILSGWAEASRFTVSLDGDAGMLAYDYEKPSQLIFKDLLGKETAEPIESCDVRFRRQLEAFADVVQRKARNTGLATFADGLAAAERGAEAAKLAK